MTVFLDTNKSSAQVCWRSSSGDGGEVHDFWLADGKARPLPVNACGFAESAAGNSLERLG